MYKKIGIIVGVVVSLWAFAASAEISVNTTAESSVKYGEQRREFKKDVNAARAEAYMEAKATRASSTEARQGVREDIRNLRASTTQMRANIREDAKNRRASTTEARVELRAEFKEKRLEIAKRQSQIIEDRLEAAILRIEKLSGRVSVALDKLESTRSDVKIARAKLLEAKSNLEIAKTKVADIKVATDNAFVSQYPREEMKKVAVLVKDAVKSIKAAHRNVAEAISAMKPGINKLRATSTATGGSTGVSN